MKEPRQNRKGSKASPASSGIIGAGALPKHERDDASFSEDALRNIILESQQKISQLAGRIEAKKLAIENAQKGIEKISAEIASLAESAKAASRKLKFARCCTPGSEFVMQDGKKISSPSHLMQAIVDYSKDKKHVLEFHVSQSGNHFHPWFDQALGMPELAEKIAHAKSHAELYGLLQKEMQDCRNEGLPANFLGEGHVAIVESIMAKAAEKEAVLKPVIKNIPESAYFILADGSRIIGLADLPSALRGMDAAVFKMHANSEKNDFSAWIADSFGHSQLAEKISGIYDKEDMANMIDVFL